MKIAHIEKSSSIYGPGDRFVIWTQGCSIHCKGCWNKEMWSFDAGVGWSTEKLINEINLSFNSIEGVTILGGEPFDQYSELVNLISRIKKIGLSLIVYTGYTLKNLYEKQYNNVLSEIDILIANPYDGKQRNTTLQWIGSENQEIYFLSNRYNQSEIEDGTYVEVLIDEFGKMTRLGFPDDF